ncbi:MAG: aldehyde dehydrogenase family protein [Rubripirellula sp.]
MQQYSDHGDWISLSTKQRCAVMAHVAADIADTAQSLTSLSLNAQRVDPVETISGELLPLCSALRFLQKHGPKVLRPRRLGVSGRPGWLWGVRSKVRRDPRGKVLILGTWNYPLLLSGVQTAQALAAGNLVLLKPAIGSESVTAAMVESFYRAGVPRESLQQLDSSTESAISAIDQGVDLIVLTGAAETGRKVLRQAAESMTPTIMELSGCDAVVVLPGADLERTATSIAFGLNFNSGATCIGPRRIVAEAAEAETLSDLLRARFENLEPMEIHPAARRGLPDLIQRAIDSGANDVSHHFNRHELEATGRMLPLILSGVRPSDEIAATDIFAPVTSLIQVANIRDAVPIVNECPYRLAASVFGPKRPAEQIGNQLRVGSVAINDLIVPTADPRAPFGGRGQSGFGVTRGAEGLLAMTVPTVLAERRGNFAPHLHSRKPTDAQTLLGALQLLHAGSLGKRWAGLRKMVSASSGRPVKTLDDSARTNTNPTLENEKKS